MKRTIALMLAVIMTLTLMATPVFADEALPEQPQQLLEIQYVGGVAFTPLRDFAYSIGATVAWDGPNQTVFLTTAAGELIIIVVALVGGFNDNGRVWVPVEFAMDLELNLGFGGHDLNIEPLEDIAPNTPVVRTTDHGAMAVDFIEIINDTLYNRVPFSYRELEAAEWIAYQLVAMGHPEQNVAIQHFTFEEMLEHMLAFGFHSMFVEFNAFEPDERVNFEDALAMLMEEEHAQIAIEAEYMGITVEEYHAMIAANLGVSADAIDEVLHNFFYSQLAGFISGYGIFDPDTTFRPASQNVVLTVPGQSERKIVVTAHYDAMLNPGASDNASGVGLLLESAYRMLTADNYFTIVYVFAGTEEVGLLGTYYYFESLTPAQRSNIVLNINADVLFEGPYFFFGTAYFDGVDLGQNALTTRVEEIASELNAEFGTVLISAPDISAMPSDQLVFLESGFTVVAFTGLARVGAPGYEEWALMPMYSRNDAAFTGTVVHTLYDCVHFINETWPNKIGDSLWTFSLFLEALLSADFSS